VIEDRNLGEHERRQVRQWYWSSVFLERFSSAVESKSRKDFSEFHRHWLSGGPAPSIFDDARRIASAEFSIRFATSNASGIYCAVFCLLAKRGAGDWLRGEHIELQSLQDHHIFPKDYLKRHGIAAGDRTNTVVNRTLIADQTNNRIRAKAPADYLQDPDIFSGPPVTLLPPHFVEDSGLAALRLAKEDPTEAGQKAALAAYDAFLAAREALIIKTIREACGVS